MILRALGLSLIVIVALTIAVLFAVDWRLHNRGPLTIYVGARTDHRPNSTAFAVVTGRRVSQPYQFLMSSGADTKDFTFRVFLCDASDSSYKQVAKFSQLGDSFDAFRFVGWDSTGALYVNIHADGRHARYYRLSLNGKPKRIRRLPRVESEGMSAVPSPSETVQLRVNSGPLGEVGQHQIGILTRDGQPWKPILNVDSLSGELRPLTPRR